MAKLLAARVAWSNADNALQIHGGNGFALEYPRQPGAVRRPHPQHLRGRRRNPGADHRPRPRRRPQLARPLRPEAHAVDVDGLQSWTVSGSTVAARRPAADSGEKPVGTGCRGLENPGMGSRGLRASTCLDAPVHNCVAGIGIRCRRDCYHHQIENRASGRRSLPVPSQSERAVSTLGKHFARTRSGLLAIGATVLAGVGLTTLPRPAHASAPQPG